MREKSARLHMFMPNAAGIETELHMSTLTSLRISLNLSWSLTQKKQVLCIGEKRIMGCQYDAEPKLKFIFK